MNKKASRQSFGEALAELGGIHKSIVVLDADLAKSTKSELFAKKYPTRFFDLGIAEQNMLGVAAGLGSTGYNAFCCSFACFVAGRFETIKMSVAYPKTNVKIIGTHAGVGIGPDGYSQMGLEDLAIMRALPNMQVFQPADDIETKALMAYLATHEGPAYVRLTRQDLDAVHDDTYRFVPGQVITLTSGTDIAIFATGGTVGPAKQAADILKSKNISASVINVSSIKPLDANAVIAACKHKTRIFTVEDHTILGGMGGAIAEIVAEAALTTAGRGIPVHRHGILDVPGESGEPDDLYRHFKLDADGIVSVVLSHLK